MNIDEYVYPESSSAERLALKLDLPGVIDSFQIHPDYRMIEIAVPGRYHPTRWRHPADLWYTPGY
ncbi:MAG TPA: hypothetical protein VGN63_24495 [Flavisolibacter sp.]|jgi:Trk K+ transport system NAD-binding subunit|nr:hypothetical protein [Flavisolibacter sp.]